MAPDVNTVTLSIGVNTAAYDAGDLMGTAMEVPMHLFRDRGGCILDNIVVTDRDVTAVPFDIYLFHSLPTSMSAGWNNNSGFSPVDGDMEKVILHMAFTAQFTAAANGGAQARNIDLAIAIPNDHAGSLYVAMVARGTPTFDTASDVKLKMTFRGL